MAGLLAQAFPESATSRLRSVIMQIPSLYSGGTAGACTPFPWHGHSQSYGEETPLSRRALVATERFIQYYRRMQHNEIVIYTDGGCSGNPGPGGWAYVLTADDLFEKEASGSALDTTNNRMELTAVIEALKAASTLKAHQIKVYTDSQYVKNGITSWIEKWKVNGWRTASKQPVKNKEYWVELDRLASQLPVSWHWVKGHAGIEGNERCDALVQEAMESLR